MRRNIEDKLPKPATRQACVIHISERHSPFDYRYKKTSERESNLIGLVTLTYHLLFIPLYKRPNECGWSDVLELYNKLSLVSFSTMLRSVHEQECAVSNC